MDSKKSWKIRTNADGEETRTPLRDIDDLDFADVSDDDSSANSFV